MNLDKILSLSDEELDAFRIKNGLQSDEEWWDFVGRIQKKEAQGEDKTKPKEYRIRSYDPKRHDLTSIINYFRHSVIIQDSSEYQENINEEDVAEAKHKVNCIIDDRSVIKVASQQAGKEHRIVGLLWHNYNYPSKEDADDKTLFLDGMVVLPKHQGHGLGTRLVWNMIRENNDRINIFKDDSASPDNTIEKVALYRPESLESTVRFYKKLLFLHCKDKDGQVVTEVNRYGLISKEMMLPLTKEMFFRCIKGCRRVKPAEVEALKALRNEELVIDYLQRTGYHEARYGPEDVKKYNGKVERFPELFSKLNPFLRPLVVRLTNKTIQREPLFQPYL